MKTVTRFFRSSTFSPQGLAAWSLLILAAFGVSHLLGFRDAVTILTGTIPFGSSAEAASFKALFYMAAYFAAVVLVPPMLLTSVTLSIWKRLCRRQNSNLPAGSE
jgi:hypothetical protein